MTVNILKVKPTEVDLRFKKFRTLPDAAIKAMVKSLERQGQRTPIVVCNEGDCLVLIDGFKRQRAAEVLGISHLTATLMSCQGALMKAHMYLLNKGSGFTMIEEGMLIRELVETDGLQQVEVAVILRAA